MSAFNEETVLSVHHWTDKLFTFTTTRDPALRFSNGHFTMIGLRVNNKPLLRAFSTWRGQVSQAASTSRCMCTAALGLPVVPEVKASMAMSVAAVGQAGTGCV